jgi:hypothetical protein
MRFGPSGWLALAVLSGCRESVAPANTARTATVEEAAAIRGAMRAYEEATLAHKGAEASSRVSRHTLDCYERLRLLALHADRAELRAAGLIDRIRALSLRARYSTAELQGMAGGSFARCVDDGHVSAEDIAGWSFGAIDVEGDRALATYISKRQGKGPRLSFHLQDGRWRVDLESFAAAAVPAYEATLLRSGRPLEETVMALVGEMVGRQLDESIWTPPLPR